MQRQTSPLSAVARCLETHLSRVTSGGHFIPEVDGIRFLAIVGVMAYHAVIALHFFRNNYTTSWMTGHGLLLNFLGMGYFGVEIFFTLSGFIVCLPFARHFLQGEAAPQLNRYYLRRLTRIEPPYLVALTVAYCSYLNFRHFLPDFLASLIYSHRYFFGADNPFDVITWSLEVEVVFYILAPLVARLYTIPGKYWRWFVQLAFIAGYSYFAGNLPLKVSARFPFAQMLQYFLAGALLADFYACGLLRRSQKMLWDLPVGAAILGLFLILKSGEMNIWTFAWTLPFWTLLLFVGVTKGHVANWFLRLRPITLTGGMCYTLYLWHCLVISTAPLRIKAMFAHMSYLNGILAYCLLFIPAIVVVLTPVYLLFERPFMNGPGSRYLERRLAALAQRFRKETAQPSELAA